MHKDLSDNVRLYGEFTKIQENPDGTLRLTGVASSEVIDSDGETIKSSAMQAAVAGFMSYGTGALREMHQPLAAGRVDSVEVRDGKTWVECTVVDPVAVLKVKTGTYKGLSVGGRVSPGGRNVHDAKIIEAFTWSELSLVDRPSCPGAVIQLWKAEGLADDPPIVIGTTTVEGTVAEKGDSPGHPFRGNQYGDGEGGGAKDPQDAADEETMIAEQERRVDEGTVNLDPDDRKAERQRLGRMGRDSADDNTDPETGETEQDRLDAVQDAAEEKVAQRKTETRALLAANTRKQAETASTVEQHTQAHRYHYARAEAMRGTGASLKLRGRESDAAQRHLEAATLLRSIQEGRSITEAPPEGSVTLATRRAQLASIIRHQREDRRTANEAAPGRTERRQAKGMPRHVPDPRKKPDAGPRKKSDTDIDFTKRIDGFTDEGEPIYTVEKGDSPGHPFRGNQYSDAGDAADREDEATARQKKSDEYDRSVGVTPAHEAAAKDHDRRAKWHATQAVAHDKAKVRAADRFDSNTAFMHEAASNAHFAARDTHQDAAGAIRFHGTPGWKDGRPGPEASKYAKETSRLAARLTILSGNPKGAPKPLKGKSDQPDVLKGDSPGHEFRGNQYSHGGGGDAPPARETKGFGKDGQPVVGRQTKAPARKKSVNKPSSKRPEEAKTPGDHRKASEHHDKERRFHQDAGGEGSAAAQARHARAAEAHTWARDFHDSAAKGKTDGKGAREQSAKAREATSAAGYIPGKADTNIDITKAAPGAPQEESMADPKQAEAGEAADAAVCDDCGATLTDGACPECSADEGADMGASAEAAGPSGGAAAGSGEAAADPSTGTREDDSTEDGTAAEGNRFQARAAKIAKAANIELAALRKERDAYAAKARDAEEKLATLSAQATTTSTKLAKISTAAETATDEVRKLRRDVNDTSESLEKMQSERDSLRERLSKVQGERDAISSEVARFRAENDDAEHAVAKLTGDRDSMSDRLTKVQGERDRADEELVKVRASRDAVETQYERVAAEKAIMDGRVAKMLTERDSSVADAARMRVERDAAEDRFEKAASEKDVLTQRLTKAHAEVGGLSDQLAKAQSGLEKAEISITKLASEIDAANARAARLTKAVDAAEGKASKVAADLDVERSAVAKLAAEASTIKKALDRARTERDEVTKDRDAARASESQKAEEISNLKKVSLRERETAAAEIARKAASILDLQKGLSAAQDATSLAKRDRAQVEKARDAALAEVARKTAEAARLQKVADAASVATTAASRARDAAARERDAANAELVRRPKGALKTVTVEKGVDTADARTGEEKAAVDAITDPLTAIRKSHQKPTMYHLTSRK